MILKASQRSGAAQLATHLMNTAENDHVSLVEMRGFVAETVHEAFAEAHAISKATKCRQFLFSLSMSPPVDVVLSDEEFQQAADAIEAKLGLTDQPRALIVHEKEGRRHAHVVWSRIDLNEMKAINLPFFKQRLNELSKEFYLDHGWSLPDGLKTHHGKNPLNFTRDVLPP